MNRLRQEEYKKFVRMEPKRIVYISQSGVTGQDLAVLDGMGYLTREVKLVEMFPMTFLVEYTVLLQRNTSRETRQDLTSRDAGKMVYIFRVGNGQFQPEN